MSWFTKKERRRKVSAFPAIFKANFGRFRHVSAVFRPVSAVSAASRYGPILAESARFSANQSQFSTNRAASARIEPSRRESKKKKKKTQTRTDAQATASDAGAAPLVPCPCFLVALTSTSLPTKTSLISISSSSFASKAQTSTATTFSVLWESTFPVNKHD